MFMPTYTTHNCYNKGNCQTASVCSNIQDYRAAWYFKISLQWLLNFIVLVDANDVLTN